ncbi:MAG: ferric reductase-like transmembrane domain-containing protein [Anaerolineae bacterium]
MTTTTKTKSLPSGLRWLAYLAVMMLTLAATLLLTVRMAPQVATLDNETIWYAIRSSGNVAYLLLAASTVWGILLSSKIVKQWVPAAVALDLHNYLSWLAIGLTILHAALLLASSYFNYSLLNLLVPFTGPFKPFWVGLGIIGLYLMIVTTVTFYATERIGYKTFHRLHTLTYVAFVASLLHSIVSGTDTAAMMPVYLATGLVVLFFTAYRLLSLPTGNKHAGARANQ